MQPDPAPESPTPQHHPASPLAEHTLIPVELTVLGARVRGQAQVPSGPTPAAELLPVFRMVTDAIVRISEKSIEQHGMRVSCTKGCGACCRQVVPVATSEAIRLRQVVDSMPEPRRGTIRARFAEAERRIAQAGLLEKLADPERFERSELDPVPMTYFRLGIACPFLEEESCSIYEERPLACREYLVTSPPRYCAAPDERVAAMRVPLKASEALARLDGTEGRRFVARIPLALIMHRAGQTPGGSTGERTGPALVEEFLGHLERTRETQAAGAVKLCR